MKSIYFQEFKKISPSKIDVIDYNKDRPMIISGPKVERNSTYRVK